MDEQEQSRFNWLCRRIESLKDTNRSLKAEGELLKMQLITVESKRQMLEDTVLTLRGKGNHIESCKTPGTAFRRIGALWQCSCGQMWRMGYGCGYTGSDKGWVKA